MHTISNDRDLHVLDELSQGSGDAFITLYNKYREWLVFVAFDLLGNEEASQDLVQEFFIDFWQKELFRNLKRVSNKSDDEIIKSYLYTSIQNRSFNYIRDNKVKTLPIVEEALPQQIQSSITNLEHKELEQEILTALNLLSPQALRIFALRYVHEKSGKEISTELSISVQTVKNTLLKASKILRNRLKQTIY